MQEEIKKRLTKKINNLTDLLIKVKNQKPTKIDYQLKLLISFLSRIQQQNRLKIVNKNLFNKFMFQLINLTIMIKILIYLSLLYIKCSNHIFGFLYYLLYKNVKSQIIIPDNQATKLTISTHSKDIHMDIEQEECQFINEPILQTRCNQLGMLNQKEHSRTTENNFTFEPFEQSSLIQVSSDHIQQQLSMMEECFTLLLESTIPDEILCRDQEKILITRFIEDGIKNNGQKQALYISGVPGIGKTATVLEVKNKLHFKKLDFDFIYFNAMNIRAPEDIYPFLYEKITNKKESSRIKSCILLTELFNSEQDCIQKNIVILLDECDNLYTTDQQVLYNLVDWPQQPNAHLIIIMIANTMDFPEKLKPKLQSRLGNHRIVFRPYNSTQIENILQQRMKTQKLKQLFASNTLNYLGKKIATISTDIRKTLSICRTAIVLGREQLLRKRVFSQIEVEHIKLAYDIIYNKPQHNALQYFNVDLKLLIIMIAIEIHIKGQNYAYFHQVVQRMKQQQSLHNIKVLSYYQMKQALIKLSQLNLIEIKEEQILLTKSNWQQKLQNSLDQDKLFNLEDILIQLKINIDDIKNALSKDDLFKEFSNLF